jgi:glycosyltransferase involved in cell wall biosynthesis
MRVLHVTSGNLFGGVETLLITLARERTVCPSMEPEFAVCFDGRLSQEISTAGMAPCILGAVRVRDPLSVWRARRQLAKLFHRQKFDVAIFHMGWPLAIFGRIARRARVPVVYWEHTVSSGRHWIDQWARRTPPDLVISTSRFVAESLPKWFGGIQSEVIYCPVPQSADDDDERESVRTELGTPSDATVIIQVSRMEGWKGHVLHLKALSRLKDVPGWVCWQIGGPQRPNELAYFESLKVMAQELGIGDRIRFAGQRTDVPRLLRAADIFCQPNEKPEPFGLVFVEALYSAIPVITTAMGGATEIVDDTCGIVTDPIPEALAAAELELIRNPAVRLRLGSAAKLRARSLCDPETQINRIADVLGTLIRRQANHTGV